MSASAPQYRKLPGRGQRNLGLISVAAARCTLWLGPDHLLSVDRIAMAEEYKRFYFRDIQAITLQKTRRAAIWNLILGLTTLGLGMLFWWLVVEATTTDGRVALTITGAIVTGIFLLLFLINLFRGPTCLCYIRTAVQREHLPSLGRLRAALKAIELLRPRIEEAQGAVPADVIAARAATWTPPTPPGAAPAASVAMAAGVGGPMSVAIHAGFFSALLVDGLVGFYLNQLSEGGILVGMVLALLTIAMGLTAVVRQRSGIMAPATKRFTLGVFFALLALILVFAVYASVSRTMYAVEHPGLMPPAFSNVRHMPGFWTLAMISNVIEVLAGAAGLVLALQHRSTPPPAPMPSNLPPPPL